MRYLPEPAPPVPSPEILYATATGDPGNPLVFPLNAVRWLTLPREMAVLVTESGRSGFAAELFHFGSQPREMGAELFLLQTGHYELTLSPASPDGAGPLLRRDVRVEGPSARVQFQLPSRRICVLRLAARTKG